MFWANVFLHQEGWFSFTLFVCLGGSAGYLIKLQTDLHYVLSTWYFCSGLNIRGTIKSNPLWCWSGICIKLSNIIHDYLTKRDVITWLNFITDITWWCMRLLHSLRKYMRWGWNLQKTSRWTLSWDYFLTHGKDKHSKSLGNVGKVRFFLPHWKRD